jgi:hypothetical protein
MNEPDVALRHLRAHHPAGKANHGIVERALFLGALVIDRHPFARRRRGEPDRRTPAELQRPVRILFRGRKGDVLVGRGENGRRRPAGRRGWRRRRGRLPWREHAGGQRTEIDLTLLPGSAAKSRFRSFGSTFLSAAFAWWTGTERSVSIRIASSEAPGAQSSASRAAFCRTGPATASLAGVFFAPSLFLKSLLFRRHLSPRYFPRSPPLRRRSGSGERR